MQVLAFTFWQRGISLRDVRRFSTSEENHQKFYYQEVQDVVRERIECEGRSGRSY